MKPVFLVLLFFIPALAGTQGLTLWYKAPATKWVEALPIGNGRLGAMIYGDPQQEHLQFNEETLWTGRPRAYAHKGAAQYLPQIRQLLADGKQAEAEALAEEQFMGLKDNAEGYENALQTWMIKVRKDTSFAGSAVNDKDWPRMAIPAAEGWESAGLEGLDGAVWFRTSFELPSSWQGKDVILDLGRIRDMDFTYINGKLVGTKEGISSNRRYEVKAAVLHPGTNTVAIQVLNFFDKGGLIGVKGANKTFLVYPKGDSAVHGVTLHPDWKYRVQNDSPPPFPQYQASYQPFGDLLINIKNGDKVTDYHRQLDIANSVAAVSYNSNGIHFTREYMASAPHNAIAIHLTADRKGAINFSAGFTSPHKTYLFKKIDDHTLSLSVKVKDGALRGVAYVYITAKNDLIGTTDSLISVSGADDATLYLVAATNFRNYKDVSLDPDAICRQHLQPLKSSSYESLKAGHIKEYRSSFDKFSIHLGASANEALPTDERILQYNGNNDPSLISLYMQYGRYLLLASSGKESRLPANLQGIWNDRLTPSWGSKFTTNINLQMNYWPAELLNLSSTTAPLFRLIKEAAVTGKATAKEHYDAPGWVLHHNTDIWLGTAPINASNHGIWQTGAAWLCHHLWEHYLFTQDAVFLKGTAYPIMKEAALFFVKNLYPDAKTGYLISSPSNSPEQGGLVAGPTMDHQIIRDLFKNTIAASRLLGKDAALTTILREKYDRIAPNTIGRWGQLQEWMEDKDDSTSTHRHVSHLWGVYPGTDITWATPELMKAARQSLLHRGDGGTGWSLAWKVNLWARLKDGDHAKKLLDNLLAPAVSQSGEGGGVYPNLFDAHPPFQIDGNFGGAAGIAEMLVQSGGDAIEILPALPSSLPNGEVKGLCARGGFELSFDWKNNKLIRVEVVSKAGKELHLKYGSAEIKLKTGKGKTYHFNEKLEAI